jgi:hypothetical protein
MIDLRILLLKLGLDLFEIGSKSLKLVLVVRVNLGLIIFDLGFELMKFVFQFFFLVLQLCSEAFALSQRSLKSSYCSD